MNNLFKQKIKLSMIAVMFLASGTTIVLEKSESINENAQKIVSSHFKISALEAKRCPKIKNSRTRLKRKANGLYKVSNTPTGVSDVSNVSVELELSPNKESFNFMAVVTGDNKDEIAVFEVTLVNMYDAKDSFSFELDLSSEKDGESEFSTVVNLETPKEMKLADYVISLKTIDSQGEVLMDARDLEVAR